MPSRQAAAYLARLGDNWFERNRDELGKRDLVSSLIERVGIKPTKVLEIGCANGWRLKKLRTKYGCGILGIDPSRQAIDDAGEPEFFRVGIATDLPLEADQCDVVILGHCLWAIEPADWLMVAAQTDRVLSDGGILIIHDQIMPRYMRRYYIGTTEGQIYHQFYYDWPKLWLSHPGYRVIYEMTQPNTVAPEVAAMLQKDFAKMLAITRIEPQEAT